MLKLNRISLIIFLIVLLSLSFVSAGDCAYYFYGDTCDDCQETNTYLDTIEKIFPDLELHRYEVYYNEENFNLMLNYFDTYLISEEAQGVPIIITSNGYFSGKEPIMNLFESQIQENDHDCPQLEEKEVLGVVGEVEPRSILERFGFLQITGSAFANAFSPASLLLILVLMLYFILLRDKEKILRRGMTFIFGVFFVHLLFALGLFSWWISTRFVGWGYKIFGVVLVIKAFLLIVSFFVDKKILLKNVNQKVKDKCKKIMDYSTKNSIIFVVAILFSFLSISKMSGIILSLRSLYLENYLQMVALPFVIYYLLVFLLPMIILILGIYALLESFEKKAENKGDEKKVDAWNKHFIKLFNFSVAVIVFVLGLVIIFV
jgi:hypothetical protein